MAKRRKCGKRSTALSARAGLPASVDGLFARVTAILDRARKSVVRSVHCEMVLAYWHIGREIVEGLQGGSERAEYGSTLIETLAHRLTRHYGKGFASTNLRYFRIEGAPLKLPRRVCSCSPLTLWDHSANPRGAPRR